MDKIISDLFVSHHDYTLFQTGTCKARNKIETKRNETERNETKSNETKRNHVAFRFASIGLVSFHSVSFRFVCYLWNMDYLVVSS
jgi:hypothetical protein